MDLVLLTALTFCWIAGAVMGGLIVAVTMLQMRREEAPDLRTEVLTAEESGIFMDEWREDLDDPEGEWQG